MHHQKGGSKYQIYKSSLVRDLNWSRCFENAAFCVRKRQMALAHNEQNPHRVQKIVDSSPDLVKPKTDYKIGICRISTKYAALRRKSKDLLAPNQDNMSELGDMSIHAWTVISVSKYYENKKTAAELREESIKKINQSIQYLILFN